MSENKLVKKIEKTEGKLQEALSQSQLYYQELMTVNSFVNKEKNNFGEIVEEIRARYQEKLDEYNTTIEVTYPGLYLLSLYRI